MVGRLVRAALTATAALLGLCFGWLAGYEPHLGHRQTNYPFLTESVPLPHHVPLFSGGLSLRFAMVHDVIHERFPKHGRVYYQERNRLTRQRLSTRAPADPASFPLADDLAAGLERLGKPGEAVVVMKEKLARQQAQGLTGGALYTTYANLGTFLIHAHFQKAVAGDPTARERFREGLALVKKSVEVNPQAHFGRERWQVAIAEFMLAAMDDPKLLQTFDCLGNRLDLKIEEILDRDSNRWGTGYGRAAFARPGSAGQASNEIPAFFQPGVKPDDSTQWTELSPIRNYITNVGAEEEWRDVAVSSHREPVPFDEPLLGIIGMWRQGGGANPHFALAIGEVMLRVGQRHIAWAAFERASRLAERFWPDPALQSFLRLHCRTRQAQMEKTFLPPSPEESLPPWRRDGPFLSPAEVADLRPRFDSELAYGEGYQRAYQEYEEKQIAAGVSITDEHFFDGFHTGREAIASPVGEEELFKWVPPRKIRDYAVSRARGWAVLSAGVAAVLAAALLRLVRRRSQPPIEPSPNSATPSVAAVPLPPQP